MKKFLFGWLAVTVLLCADMTDVNIVSPSFDLSQTPIRFLDQKVLQYSQIDGLKFSEISDLAYDPSTHRLYMISDEGILFVFNARFGKKIEVLEPIKAVPLLKKGGKVFKKWRRDSEGMTLDGRKRLLISFEGKPKIGWFHKNSEKMGQRIKKYLLPKVLRNSKAYRSRNKSLEALAWHPRYGVLTAAEWPLKHDDKKRQTIYSLNGRRWHFKAGPEPKSAISAMEVTDRGNLLVIERSYTGLLDPFVVTLKLIYLDRCKKGWCPSKVLLKMDSHKGWDVDNFEGLTKVGKYHYVMISDDNNNFFQKTLLIYFEVKE